MSTCVCVLSNSGERLMPTIRLGKVRRLLKDGKAKIVKHHPFTIQLLYDSKTNTQPIEICEDVGYNYIGISVKSESHEYVSAQYDTLQDEKEHHDDCRKYRRTRRNRLRYRKPRFDNRKRSEGWLAPSVVTFQNDDKEILSGTRTMGEGLTLTVAAEAEEGQETEQEAVIEKLLADAVITDTAPATTVFGETVKDDVVIEADDGYLQLQLNDNTVLVSTFSFNYDKTVFSKTLNLPGGLTVRYGNVQDKETGYIPFVSTVNNRNIKILATSVKALQGFFQG